MNSVFGQPTSNPEREMTCPHLGLADDPATSLGFPSEGNCCQRVRPVAAPNLGHQEAFCLSARFGQCPLFEREGVFSLPAELQASRPPRRLSRPGPVLTVLAAVLLVVVAGLAYFKILPGQWPFAVPTGTALLPAANVSPTAVAEETVPGTSTAGATPQVTPGEAPSSTARPLLAVDVPMGLKNQFLIHRVLEGDSLDLLASRYHTSIAAIQAVNVDLPAPLRANSLVIIPLGLTDAQDLPPFGAHLVTEGKVTVRALAEKLSCELDSFTYYNALQPDFVLEAGDWVLVPR